MKFTKVKLNDICNLITCGVAKRPNYVETGVPFLSARNIKKQKIIWNNFKFITQKTHEELTKHNKPLKGDILYTRVGSYGEAAIIDEDREFSLFVSLTLIKPKHDIVNNKFLVYFLNSPMGKLLAKNNVNSSGVGNLNVGKVRNFEIFLPSLQEQQRIVAKLDTAFAEIDKVIAIKKASEENIEKLKNSVLNNLLNNNFLDTKIGDICTLIYGKGLPKEKRVNKNGIPAYGANGIKCYAAEPLYNKPSIIIGRKGSAGELQWVDNPFWALDVTYYVLPNEKKVNLKFLYYLLQMQNLPKLAKGVKPGINRNEVYNIDIKLPPIDEQIKITVKLEKVFKQQKILEELDDKIIANYHSLKLAIISKEIKNKAA